MERVNEIAFGVVRVLCGAECVATVAPYEVSVAFFSWLEKHCLTVVFFINQEQENVDIPRIARPAH